MDQTTLLLEYLKEHYTQSRQHETRQTNATTFLTSAAGVIVGFSLKDGNAPSLFIGALIFAMGLANIWINYTHYRGNRFHTSVAGEARRTLEEAISPWTADKPSVIRARILAKHGLAGPGKSIGGRTTTALQLVPILVCVAGIGIVVASGQLTGLLQQASRGF